MNELAYNLESFNPAFTAVLLKVLFWCCALRREGTYLLRRGRRHRLALACAQIPILASRALQTHLPGLPMEAT